MVIGITGGVGCGKSTVMSVLAETYGAKTILADEIGHEALQPGKETYYLIRELFGDSVVFPDGQLDREQIAQLIYGDEALRNKMNEIVHPYVKKQIKKFVEEWGKETLVAVETALMFETGCHEFCNQVWYVKTSPEKRIQRLIQSRGYTKEKAESIMAAQMSDEEEEKLCDACVINDGEIKDLQIRLQELLGIY